MHSNNNWFERARSYDMPLFLQQRYSIEVNKHNKCLCPFHKDTKPSLSMKQKGGEWIFNCFVCDTKGDITKFVEYKEKVSPLDAVRIVLRHFGEDVSIGEEKKELSPEQKAEIEKNRIAAAKRKEAERKKEERARAAARAEMAKAAPVYAENLYTAFEQGNEEIIKQVEQKFPNIYNNLEVRDVYMGWSYEDDSLVLINRDLDGNVFNIKAERRKGIFKNWKFGAKFEEFDFPGKWISWRDATTRVFGLEFLNSDDNRVIICEGEKDAINLMLLGINALTLGGVTTSWDDYKEILRDKEVYIWFDNDYAGYLNAIKRYREIKEVAKNCQIVLFFKIGNFGNKYDISDYLVDEAISLKEDVYKKIIYSCFKPVNSVIAEIETYTGKDFTDLKEPEVIKEFKDCKADIIKAVKDVRGEKDEEVRLITFLSKQLESSTIKDELQKLINSLFPEKSEFLGHELSNLKQIVSFKKSLFTAYRQTHLFDMATELIRATKSEGYEFAKYREALYFWTGNYYYYLQDWEIKDFILQEFFPAAKIDFKKQTVETRNKILDNLYGWSISLEAWIDRKKRVINMSNGALIIRESGKITFRNHHDKKDCAMNMLDFEYDPKAKAPKWQAFLNRVLPDKLDQYALMEFIGYCFLPSHKFEKFLLMYGSTGANGKSVILDVIRDFFSRENTSSLELHRFEGHELDALKNKIINLGSEIESGGDMRKQFAALKNLTSTKDTLTVNPKNKDTYELYPEEKPKMAFATNKLIKSGADDGGVLRRMLLLQFKEEIRDDEKIRDLTERFRDERSGILNMAIAGLQRLIKQNGFSESEGRAKFMDEYKSDINPVRAYIKENIVKEPGVMIAKKFVYEHYKAWCEERGVNAYADRTFWSKFKEQFGDFEETRVKQDKYSHQALAKVPQFIKNVKFTLNGLTNFQIGNIDIDLTECNIDMESYKPIAPIIVEKIKK